MPRSSWSCDTPWLKAKDRLELYNAGRALAGKFHDTTRALDDQENTSRKVTDLLPEFDRATGGEGRAGAGRRAAARRPSISCGLAGLPPDQPAKELADARQTGRYASLAHELRRTWAEQLPRQLGELSELPAQVRLARIVAAFDRIAAAWTTSPPTPFVSLQQGPQRRAARLARRPLSLYPP